VGAVEVGVDAAATASSLGNCDLTVEGPVCLMHNRRVLLPAATPAGLVGHWDFDEAWPTDSSGSGLHARNRAPAGQGVAHDGFSGSFDRSQQDFQPVVIPDPEGRLNSADASLTFWMFVVRPPPSSAGTTEAVADCAVVVKGDVSSASSTLGNPAVYLNSAHGQVSFAANNNLQHSRARVLPGRWTHVRFHSSV
jgi:hypothetical protein